MTAEQASDDDDLQEDPLRPFESWLHDYMNDSATVDALGPLGAKCRDAADELVTELLANADEPAARARFTRSLGFMILDSYLQNGWETYEL
jgi:hypothetical protein